MNFIQKTVFTTLIIFSLDAHAQKKVIDAYDASISGHEFKYISIAIGVGFENNRDLVIDSIVGYAVLPYGILSEILKKDGDRCFADVVFRKLFRNEALLVNNHEYKELFPYLISINDGDKWRKFKTKKLLKNNADKYSLTGKFVINPREILPYDFRCIMHNLVHNGICVDYNDEGGVWMWIRY